MLRIVRYWMTILLLFVLALGLVLRLPNLADRPMHYDEADHAGRFGLVLEEGAYEYDAEDHHGPALYYLTLPIAWLTGQETFAEINEKTVRLLPVVFGLLLIATTPLLRNGMGGAAVLFSALFAAVSPAFVYYSRFYMPEVLLVFFTCLMLGAGWQSWHFGKRSWALICGLAAGLMFATKETAVLSYAAMAGAALLCSAVHGKLYLPIKNIVLGLIAAVLVSALLFSAFCTNADGPIDVLMAFKGYFAHGSGVETDPVHAWNYYLRMLTFYRVDHGPVWSEALFFILGSIGCYSISMNTLPQECNRGLARFLMFYTLILTGIYCAIPYKIPWCSLSFLYGWILLAGYGCASLLRIRAWRWVFLIIILVSVLQMTAQAKRGVGRYAADYRNPYVYAHTTTDIKKLIKRVYQIKGVSSAGRKLHIQIIADPRKMRPLPFYLREFSRVGFWNDPILVPKDATADIIITPAGNAIDSERYITEYYKLRTDTLLAVHIRSSLWNQFMETVR